MVRSLRVLYDTAVQPVYRVKHNVGFVFHFSIKLFAVVAFQGSLAAACKIDLQSFKLHIKHFIAIVITGLLYLLPVTVITGVFPALKNVCSYLLGGHAAQYGPQFVCLRKVLGKLINEAFHQGADTRCGG